MTRNHSDYTPAAWAFTEIALETFRLSGILVGEGDKLTKNLGLTSARWKVLGAIDLAERPLTVPQIARRMGLTRQAVQRIVSELEKSRLVELLANPDHLRSPMVQCTQKGEAIYGKIMQRHVAWANLLTKAMHEDELTKVLEVLRKISCSVEQIPYTDKFDPAQKRRGCR